MPNFNQQLNNQEFETKTIQELTRECFVVNKPIIDVSFFYTDTKDHQDKKESKKSSTCK